MAKITREMTFGELLQQYPDTVGVLGGYGLHCIGCHIAVFETIEQGARAHGLEEAQIDQMLAELNAKAG
jgi:hybrid cluster-associated redox disulfide protein